MDLLHVEELSKCFTLHHLGGKRIQGFSQICFDMAPGQVLVLSGPSGAGKSSVLKCIYRTYLPSDGRMFYTSEHEGELDLAALQEHHIIRLRRRELGYVSQFLRVLPRDTATDIVAEPLIRQGTKVGQARGQAKTLLSRLNIPGKLHDAYPVTYSGGEQQRVNIARGVVASPRLLLLDEPTASLDAASVQIVLDLLDALTREGTTIIMICHDKKVVEKMADTIIPMLQETALNKPRFDGAKENHDPALIITKGNLILPDRIAEKTDLVIVGGKIAHIGNKGVPKHAN